MKRIIIYYSLSGNTEEDVKVIADKLQCETLKIETVKSMPNNYAAQIVTGGGQVLMGVIPKIKPININLDLYDEIILATPVWNGKCVPAMNSLIKNYDINDRVTGLIITSGSGKIDKCLDDLKTKLPNIKYHVSLLDRKQEAYNLNPSKIDEFVNNVK